MFSTILMLLTGLALSGVAAWFSVAGLIAIFSAAPTSIMIMGGTLEVAKLVCASWVYNNWGAAPRALKAYMSVAVVVLMFITSMGIFGYLSKAHLEQRAATSDTSLQLERVTQEITIKESQLARLQGTEDRLNRAVDALIEKDRVTQALAQRDRMKRELRGVSNEKKSLQKEIDTLYQQKIPLELSNRQIEAEIGPLKYIAELIYGEQAKSHFDQAVRAVIIILIVVFDPLAVIMLIAANFGMAMHRKNAALTTVTAPAVTDIKEQPHQIVEEKIVSPEPVVEPEPVVVEQPQPIVEPEPVVVEQPQPVVEPEPVIVQQQEEDLAVEKITPITELVNMPVQEAVVESAPLLETVQEEIAPVELTLVEEPNVAPYEPSTSILEMIQNEETSNNLVWDVDTKSWQKDTPEFRWRQNITKQLNRLTPDTNELISLETVRRLMHKLTNNLMTVEELSWAECEAILKYLDNDKPANIA